MILIYKLNPGIDIPDFLFYICGMSDLRNFIVKRKYDLLSVCSIILMLFVHVLFAIPALLFLVIDISKSKL